MIMFAGTPYAHLHVCGDPWGHRKARQLAPSRRLPVAAQVRRAAWLDRIEGIGSAGRDS